MPDLRDAVVDAASGSPLLRVGQWLDAAGAGVESAYDALRQRLSATPAAPVTPAAPTAPAAPAAPVKVATPVARPPARRRVTAEKIAAGKRVPMRMVNGRR